MINSHDSYTCRQQSRPSTGFVDNMIDLPWLNFRSQEFGIKFWREVPLFLEVGYLNFIAAQCSIGSVEESLHAKTQLYSSICFDTIPACGRQTDKQTDGRTDKRRQQIVILR